MIVGTGLCKSFGGETVLEDVDVHVRRGHVLGLIGPGGAGKSVLLKMLCGLVPPDQGQVAVEGQDLAGLGPGAIARVRERFGLLFQNYALFDFMTVGENVGFPLVQQHVAPGIVEERVASRLAEVELPGTEHLFPSELSGGMKKRVSLARATIAGAPLLLYDDPTAGLDPVTSSKIFRLIDALHSDGGATVIVGHDVDRMRSVCDEWLLLHEGRVRFRGTTDAAQRSPDEVVRVFFDDSGTIEHDPVGGEVGSR